MSSPTLTPPEKKSQSAFTPEERKWLGKLANLVGDAAGDSLNESDASAAPSAKQAEDIVAVPFAPALAQWGPEVLKVIREVGGGHRVAAIEVVNHSDRKIFLGKSSFNGGGTFKKLPQRSIDAGGKDQFVATSPDPIPVIGVLKDGCIGKMNYLLD